MLPSIKSLRDASGGLGNLSDEEIISATYPTYQKYYGTVDEYAKDIGYAGAGRGMGSSRVSAGVDNYQAGLYGLGGAVSRAVGAEGAADYFDDGRKRNEQAAQYADQRAKSLGAVDDFRDVTGVGSGLNYLGGLAAQSLPYAAEAVAGGGLVGGLMKGTRAALRGATTAQEVAAASRSLATGQTLGGVAASYPSAVGDILGNQREAGGENLGAALAGGVPYAALNAFGVEGLAARGFRPLTSGQGGLARRVATGAGVTSLGEGLGETGQEMVNQSFGRMAVDPNETLFNESANKRYLDSFVGGAALGGVFGGAGGIRGPRTVDQGPTNLLGETDPQTVPPAPPQPPPQLGYDRNPRLGQMTVFPDGSASTNEEQTFERRFLPQPGAQAAPAAPQVPGANMENDPAVAQTLQAQQEQIAQQAEAAKAQQDAQDRYLVQTAQMLGVTPVADLKEGVAFDVLGTRVYGQPAVKSLVTTMADLSRQLSPDQQQLQAAVLGSGLVKFVGATGGLTPKKIIGAVANKLKGMQLDGIGSLASAAEIVNDQIATMVAAGKTEADPKLGQMAVFYEKLTGQAPPALDSKETVNVSDPSVSAAGDAPGGAGPSPVVNGSVGAAGPVPAVPGRVRGDTGNTGAANQPVSVVADGAAQPPTAVKTKPAKAAPAPAAPVEAQVAAIETEAQTLADEVRQDLVKVFGERDTNILVAALVDRMPAADIATKYDVSRGRVAQLAGEGKVGVAEREKKFAKAEKEFGLSKEYLRSMMGKLMAQSSQVDELTNNGQTNRELSIADLGDTAQANLGEAGFSTVETAGGSTSNYKDSAAAGGKTQTRQATAQLAELRDALANAESIGDDERATELTGKINDLQSQFVSAGDRVAARTQAGVELLEKSDALEAAIKVAEDAGSSTIAGKDKKLTLANAKAEVAGLKAQAQYEISLAEQQLLAMGTAPTAAAPKRELPADLAAAKDKFKSLKYDVTKMTSEELKLLRPVAFDMSNTEMVRKIDAQLESPAAPNSVAAKPGSTELAVVTSKGPAPAPKPDAPKAPKPPPRQDSGQAMWESLRQQAPNIAPYEDLSATERGYLTELADRTGGDPKIARESSLLELMANGPSQPATPAPAALADDSRTIEGETRFVDEPLRQQVKALLKPQIRKLELHYGKDQDSPAFLTRLKEDIALFITQGADAVAGAIRESVRAVANGLMSMALIFNPNIVAPNFTFDLPAVHAKAQAVVAAAPPKTRQVEIRDQVPGNAVAKMSPMAQQVYETMAPTARASGKGFIIADKPNGMLHFFNADGSVLVQDPALFGKDAGDTLSGQSSLLGGKKVTPAGQFTLKPTADAEYAGGQRLDLVETEAQMGGGVIAIHAAYLGEPKENRLARLNSASAADNKISYGCINTKHDAFLKTILPNIENFNGGMIFVLPDAQETTAAMFPAKTETQRFENINRLTTAASDVAEASRRSPSLKRAITGLVKRVNSGELSPEGFAGRVQLALNADNNEKQQRPVNPRLRGADFIRQKLLEAKRRGELSEEAVDLAEWFILKNPALVEDLAISVRASKNDNVAGSYNPLSRMVNLIKGSGNDETVVHEILHHMERMMPAQMQGDIRKAWVTSLMKAEKNASTPEQQLYYKALSDFHFGTGSVSRAGLSAAQAELLKQTALKMDVTSRLVDARALAEYLLKTGAVGYEHYQHFNPSEYWAVNGSRILEARFGVSTSMAGKIKQWLRELVQKIKGVFGMKSDAAVIRALDSLVKGDGKFVTGQNMITEAQEYNDMTARPSSAATRSAVPKSVRPQVTMLTQVLKAVKDGALNTVVFSEDLFKRAADMGLKSAQDMNRIYRERSALTGNIEREVTRVENLFQRIPKGFQGTGPQSANRFLYDSTRTRTWGAAPTWRDAKAPPVKVDPAMAKRYQALPKEARVWVDAVLEHGDKLLALKKNTLLESTTSEYDALIAGARAAGDTDKVDGLTKDKIASLKQFTRLFTINEFMPYAPMRRFGNWVVVARSKAYDAALASGDAAQISKLESDPDHYHVSFAESLASALELQRELKAEGHFTSLPEPKRKEDTNLSLYGGLMSAFTKLRGNIESELNGATDPKEIAALKAARQTVVEMYLQSLSENSARKSEMRRRGVAGEIDMLRSFSTQGRADAHFLAAAKYNPQAQQAVVKMRQEKNQPGDETAKSMAFNEVMARHEQSMKFEEGGWFGAANAAARVSSVWLLATNPMYYLQNLTQPFVLSLPFMAGKHDYNAASGQLVRAYFQLGALLKSAKAGEGFDFSQVSKDKKEQEMVLTLVDRGRIDIGMDTELGRVKLDGNSAASKALNQGDQWLRSLSQKVEAINRVSTALAAYRLERAAGSTPEQALEYADSVISQTHGDYTRINAPRAFNTPAGKVALQFRKFQLIQLTLLSKLVYNSVKGGTAAEKTAARRALTFTLAHTGVLAGVVGMPGFAAAAFVIGKLADAFGDDDAPYNLENELRKLLGNSDAARLVMRGAPTLAGTDLSGKLGMGTALSILPFTDFDASREGFNAIATGLTLGATGGLGAKVFEGLGQIKDGDYYNGLTKLAPVGVANAMKAFTESQGGVTRKNGDVLVKPDEIATWESFAKAIGWPTAADSERRFDTNVAFDDKGAFQDKANSLKTQYTKARRDGDSEAATKAIEAWQRLQTSRRNAGFAAQPLSSLMKAPQEQAKRERNTTGGLQFDKRNRQFVQEQTQ